MFKKTIITTALLVLATPAFAETVQDHYKTEIDEQNPYRVEVCKDVATVPGAIIGADVVNKNGSKPGSTQRQCQVETRYEETQREVYSHSTVTFYSDGRQYTVKFIKRNK